MAGAIVAFAKYWRIDAERFEGAARRAIDALCEGDGTNPSAISTPPRDMP
jgi:hypothetical protein